MRTHLLFSFPLNCIQQFLPNSKFDMGQYVNNFIYNSVMFFFQKYPWVSLPGMVLWTFQSCMSFWVFYEQIDVDLGSKSNSSIGQIVILWSTLPTTWFVSFRNPIPYFIKNIFVNFRVFILGFYFLDIRLR